MTKTNRGGQEGQIRVAKIFLIRIKKRQEDRVREVNLNKIKVLRMKWKVEKEILKKKYWS